MYMRMSFALSTMVFLTYGLLLGASSQAQTLNNNSFTVELPEGEGKAQVQTLCPAPSTRSRLARK